MIDKLEGQLEAMKGKDGEQFTKRRASINSKIAELQKLSDKESESNSQLTELIKAVQSAGSEYHSLLSKLVNKDGNVDNKYALTLVREARERMMKYLKQNESISESVNESYDDVLIKLEKEFDKSVELMRGTSIMQVWNRPEAAIWIDLGERKQFCDENGKLLIRPK